MSDLIKENEDLPECLAPEWLGSTGEFTCSLLFLPLVQESANNALLFFLLSDSEEAV